ncbi:MAG: RDD family protein [Zoogloeaceae bacterium]|nr:RDD family protein [Zoogloeaceae bacterium]
MLATNAEKTIPRLDTIRRVRTPEGCELELRLAGGVVRARAWIIDFLLRLLILVGCAFVLSQIGRLGGALLFLLYFLLEWLYPVVFEVLCQGATPGKRFSGLMVLRDDGTSLDWSASVARNFLRAVDFLPFCYAFGLVTMGLNRENKRLGDLLAGTLVVYRQTMTAPKVTDDDRKEEVPPFALSEAEQRALIEYRLRAPGFSRARAGELARLASPLIADLPPDDARDRLIHLGNRLLGRGALAAKTEGSR